MASATAKQYQDQFGTAVAKTTDGARTLMAAKSDQVVGHMSDASAHTSAGVSGALTQARSKFDAQEQEGRGRITGLVDSALARNDQVLAQLPAKVDGAGEKTSDGTEDKSSFWQGVWDGIKEWVMDIVHGVGALLATLWGGLKRNEFWAFFVVIVLIVVIVVAIIFWPITVMVLTVVGIVAGVVALVYYAYMAFGKGLTWYQRGKYVGKALVELILLLLSSLKFLRGLGGAGKAGTIGARLAELVKDAELLESLRILAGNDAKLLAVLELGVDARKLEAALKIVKDIDEISRLLEKVKDIDRLLPLLEKVRDGKRLLALLDDVSDTNKLSRLLDKVPVADRLLEMLKKVPNADRLEALLERVKNGDKLFVILKKAKDADQVERLLNNVADLDRLLNLLTEVRDGDQLEHLITAVGDVNRLELLLRAVDNAAQLEELLANLKNDALLLEGMLDSAGAVRGNGNAARLLDLYKFAIANGHDARDCEDLVSLAGGKPNEFRELASLPKEFPPGRGSVPNPQPSNLAPGATDPPGAQAFTSANTTHFLDEHTFKFYDFAKTGTVQSFWPSGTTEQQVVAALEEAIRFIRANGITLSFPNAIEVPITSVPGVQTVQIGEKAGRIGQFFPKAGAAVIKLSKLRLQDIAKIVAP